MKKQILVILLIGLTGKVLAQVNDQDQEVQVIAEDLVVQGSLAVGIDAPSAPSFGFDTFRLQENNLRIHFDDTSASASFPGNDWRITVNDSDNGGLNHFSIDDATAGTVPFRIVAGAGNNALYVDAQGDVGVGTSNPVLEFQITDGDSPGIRIEQDGSAGWGSQTWDVAGNETNFFIRDVTNGSQLPFKIKPGADNNALYIDADNEIGLGTSNPQQRLDVNGSADIQNNLYVGTPGNNYTVNANASVQLMSTTQGFMVNKLSALERLTLTSGLGADDSGLMVYDTDSNALFVWNGTSFIDATSTTTGGTDDQGVDVYQLNGTNLEISLEDNNVTSSVDLSPLLTDLETRVTALENANGAGSGTVPELLNYQTAVRDSGGSILANQAVSFRMSVLEGGSSGTPVYVETHSATTSSLGLVNFHIGSGAVVSGVFDTIDWGSNSYYLQVELDATGGSTYAVIGATQFVSVPYALRAKSADIVNSFAGSEKISENTQELKKALETIEVLKAENEAMKKQLDAIMKKLED